jgi:hypothetical protein
VIRGLRHVLGDEEPVPDVWAEVAGVLRGELERRKSQPPEVLSGLETDALAVLGFLHAVEHGRTFLARLIRVVPNEIDFDTGFCDLVDLGLVMTSWAIDEDGDPAELVVTLRYDVELPPPKG